MERIIYEFVVCHLNWASIKSTGELKIIIVHQTQPNMSVFIYQIVELAQFEIFDLVLIPSIYCSGCTRTPILHSHFDLLTIAYHVLVTCLNALLIICMASLANEKAATNTEQSSQMSDDIMAHSASYPAHNPVLLLSFLGTFLG